MVLVDTSVWIAHFRKRDPVLVELLGEGLVLGHSFVSGELACGKLGQRASVLADFAGLPAAARASDAEVLQLIEVRTLWGRGLGWVDIHLLASALLSRCRFWTLDKKLGAAAKELGLY